MDNSVCQTKTNHIIIIDLRNEKRFIQRNKKTRISFVCVGRINRNHFDLIFAVSRQSNDLNIKFFLTWWWWLFQHKCYQLINRSIRLTSKKKKNLIRKKSLACFSPCRMNHNHNLSKDHISFGYCIFLHNFSFDFDQDDQKWKTEEIHFFFWLLWWTTCFTFGKRKNFLHKKKNQSQLWWLKRL